VGQTPRAPYSKEALWEHLKIKKSSKVLYLLNNFARSTKDTKLKSMKLREVRDCLGRLIGPIDSNWLLRQLHFKKGCIKTPH